ncbi:MAG TPA: maleylacetate reductase, partial [Chloroflexota bacterium]
MRFVHDTLPQRIVFGSGEAAAHLEREVAELDASRVMLIASKRAMDIAAGITGNLRVLLRYDDVVMHVPVEVAAR